jgi:hypothetical protein
MSIVYDFGVRTWLSTSPVITSDFPVACSLGWDGK